MTRSIGDFMFKMNLRSRQRDPGNNALSNEPDVQEFIFDKDKNSTDMILMGCDGIWDGTVESEDNLNNEVKDGSKPPDGY